MEQELALQTGDLHATGISRPYRVVVGAASHRKTAALKAKFFNLKTEEWRGLCSWCGSAAHKISSDDTTTSSENTGSASASASPTSLAACTCNLKNQPKRVVEETWEIKCTRIRRLNGIIVPSLHSAAAVVFSLHFRKLWFSLDSDTLSKQYA